MAPTNPTTGAAAPPFPEVLGTEIVKLHIGPNKEFICVHKALLCQKVPYFAKMFQGGFKEAGENTATFPEDNMESFGLLIEWVYTGNVRPLTCKASTPKIYAYNIVEFYVLAEKICAFHLADCILETWRVHQAANNELMALQDVRLVYDKTESKSPLRRYSASSMAYVFMTIKNVPNLWPTKEISDLIGSVEDLRKDFLFRLRTVSVSPPAQVADPRYAPICEYHRHGKKEACSVKKAS